MAIQAGDAVWTIRGDIGELKSSLDEATGEVEKASGNVTQSFATVGKGMTAVGAAITAPLALGVKAAIDFGSGLASVASLGVQDMGKIEDAVRSVAVQYGQDLTGAVNATYQAISAGVSEMEAPYVLEQAAIAATAGQTDLTTAIELGAAMTNAFGLEMGNMQGVFDAAFVAVKSGVTTFEELSSSAGKTAPAFAAAGLSVDEMYASVGALTKGGLGTAESFTALNAVIASFTRQGEVGKLETLGLEGALKWLAETTGGNQTAMLEFLGSTEAMTAVLSLTGGQAQSFNEILAEMAEKTGAAGEAFEIIAENDPAFTWNVMKASLQNLAITVGQILIPALQTIVKDITPVIQAVAEWMKENEELTAGIVMVNGVLGVFMITVGPLLMMLPGIVALFTAVSAILPIVGAAFAAVATVLSGPVIAAIVAVVAVGALIYAFWDEIKEVFQAGVDFVLAIVEAWWDGLVAAFQVGIDVILGIASLLWDGIGAVFDWGVQFVSDVWNGFLDFLSGTVDVIMSIVDAMAAPFIWLGEQVNAALNLVGLGQAQGVEVPGYAEGGALSEGMNVVGERGPEAIIKQGSEVRVMSAANTASMGAGNVTVNMNGVSISNDMDINHVAKRLGDMLRQRMTGIGMSPAATRI